MKFIFYSEEHFEPWDWTNSIERGIGGSETSHVEMAWRLARRGHDVISYAPVPWEGTKEWRGTTWTHSKNVDWSQDGTWIIYRVPASLDNFGPRHVEQPRWLMCQDAHYGDLLTRERADKLDRVIALCPAHAWHLGSIYPQIKDKMWITSNGVKVDLIREIEAGIMRNPRKLIYASSPDRGLVTLLKIFKRVHELESDLELHIFYGFDNIDRLTAGKAPWTDALIEIKGQVEQLAKQPGVFLRGRISQRELYQEWLSAGLWCYPTEFTETSCITALEAQAMGAIPIFNPLWALESNVGHGIAIEGSPYSDALVQARYVSEIIRLTRQPELAEKIRQPMMLAARNTFNWERFVDQWESDVLGLPPTPAQFCFQHKHARGRVLNVGCDSDHTGWLERGAVNMDVRAVSPITGMANRYHILHDAREPFPESIGKFDTVILGDILEHIAASDWSSVLANAQDALTPKGQIIITCPDDGHRERLEQHRNVHGDVEYAPGCNAFHHRTIPREEIEEQLQQADLQIERCELIDYSMFTGYGVICKPVPVKKRVTTESYTEVGIWT